MFKHLDVLFVCINADPPTSGFAIRTISMLNTLVDAGYKVGIVRLVPAFHGALSWKVELSKIDLSVIYELKIFPISKYVFSRFIGMTFGYFAVRLISFLHSVKVVQCESHEAAYCLLMFRLPHKYKIFVDVHGAVPEESMFNRGILGLETSSSRHWLKVTEKKFLYEADQVFVVSHKMKDHLALEGDVSSVSVVPIGFSLKTNSESSVFTLKRELGFSDEIVFVYSGGIQAYQCVDLIFVFFTKIKKFIPKSKLIFMVNDSKSFENMYKNEIDNLKNDLLYMSVHPVDVLKYLQIADFGFLLRKNHLINLVSCPTKFGEYLAAGVSVIATNFSGHAPFYISNFNVGIVVSDNLRLIDFKLLAQKIIEMHTDSQRYNCRETANNHLTWSAANPIVLSAYKKYL